MIQKKGIGASPGVAIATALILDTEEFRIPRRTIDAAQAPQEVRTLEAALAASCEEVKELRVAATRKLGEKTAEIFAFHLAILTDKRLRDSVVDLIEKYRYPAAYAFGQEMNRRQREFRAVADSYLKERVRDLYDIEKRVLRHILGKAREDIRKLTEPVVIVAHDITPSQAVTFDREHILGFAINVGGQTSHMSIIARMLGIPAVVGLNDITSDITGGETIVVDGTNGIVIADPDGTTVARFRQQQLAYKAHIAELAPLRDQPAITLDGVQITLQANIELAEEARTAITAGAEGIGLYRTEFMFLANERPPTEEQQYEVFRGAVRHAQGRPLTLRTIDLGADKMMRSMRMEAHDANPTLGLRSLRYCLQHLDMFKTHLRAMLRAAVEGDVRIMFPMITTVIELRQAMSIVNDVKEDLEEEGVPFGANVPLGMMVETPAAALLMSSFARHVDFVSIGTNDLTQYTLAVDRGNERVAHLYASHSPAVLRLLRETIKGCKRFKTPVSLCGEMAGARIYTQLLLGLGLRSLSMAAPELLEVKQVIRSTRIADCEALARKVLRFDADRQVLNALREQLDILDGSTD